MSDKSANYSVTHAERDADYWVFGGIFRPVWLQAEPAQFVDRVAIDARADIKARRCSDEMRTRPAAAHF